MILFMHVCIQTFERVSVLVALLAEEEIIAVLAHPTILHYHFLAVETVIHSLLVESWL